MNEHSEFGLVLYQEITDPDTDEVIGYSWNCLQCESGSGASSTLEEVFWAGSGHRETFHQAKIEDRPLWDSDRITEAVDRHVERHPGMWVFITVLSVVVVALLLVRVVWT